MKRPLALLTAVGVLAFAAIFTAARPDKPTDTGEAKLIAAVEAKNPWTALTPNVAPGQFQFCVVSDRTGGHRAGIFSRAVHQINLLQPEFVVSVGDLIEGSTVADTNRKQWDEFDGYLAKLGMPFFRVAGNHDANNVAKAAVWTERYGKRHYHFTYQNCLFVCLNGYDEEGLDATKDASYAKVRFGKAQVAWLEQTLAANAGVRWAFVFVHHPIWAERDFSQSGWLDVEKALAGRKYTVFAGHRHTYRKYLRNGTTYYQLATTGGGSSLRGPEYGEFDQIAWVTMKADGPVLANVMLGGILKDDLQPFPSDEAGRDSDAIDGLVAVTGTATLAGKPAAGLEVIFTEIVAAPKRPLVGGGRVSADGAFAISANRRTAGLKPGRYAVTFGTAPQIVVGAGPAPENPIPAKYRSVTATPFRVDVVAGPKNEFAFDLE